MHGSIIGLCEKAKTIKRVDSELSKEFEVKIVMHQGSVLSPSVSAVVVDAVTELVRGGVK